MARRYLFGGIADYVVTLGTDNQAVLAPSTDVQFWNAESAGSQITDLVETDGSTPIPGGVVTTDATGALAMFYGPDDVTAVYADASGGAGPRRAMTAVDLGDDVLGQATALNDHSAAVNPHGTTMADLADVYDASIDILLAQDPFAIAHRGSGGEFPEHTLRAYEAALAAGAQAIEVSVHTTADGVPVAFHDVTLDRMTDFTGPIEAWTYGALREKVKVNARGLLGSGWSDQDIPTLEEVMNALYGRCVIFLEAKSNPSVPVVQDYLLSRYPGCQRSVVWKGYYASTSFAWAVANGFRVWAYMDAGTTPAQLDAVDTNVDYWGVPHTMADADITVVVNRGKPVICWEVHRHSEITRLTGLGVQGLMQSQWVYLNKQPEVAADLFDSEISIPGTLGIANYSETYALKYDGAGAYIDVVPAQSALLGGHRAPDGDSHTITFSMKWDTVPIVSLHSGVAFCKVSDDKYQFGVANASGGYHLVMRGNGDMQLYSHAPGVVSGTQLANIPTDQPVNGVYMDFEVVVTPTTIRINRTDGTGWTTGDIGNVTYRGRYWHLSVGSVNSLTNKPTWQGIAVT